MLYILFCLKSNFISFVQTAGIQATAS